MEHVHISIDDGIAEVRLERGKVNALDERVVDELASCLRDLAQDSAGPPIVLRGSGRFFSFGFDIPHFLGFSKAAFSAFVASFTSLYRDIFLHPRPVVAALNGHAVAGGCMLATACDARVMVTGKAKIGLNEIGFGSSVFAGSVDMLTFWVGARRAQQILYSGALYPAEEARALRLVDVVTDEAGLRDAAREVARDLAARDAAAFRSIKGLLRRPIAEAMLAREPRSIEEFVDIWYSEPTWKRLQEIRIHA
jgi:Delta3-Delta2-enoyl-CoA isomerase